MSQSHFPRSADLIWLIDDKEVAAGLITSIDGLEPARQVTALKKSEHIHTSGQVVTNSATWMRHSHFDGTSLCPTEDRIATSSTNSA